MSCILNTKKYTVSNYAEWEMGHRNMFVEIDVAAESFLHVVLSFIYIRNLVEGFLKTKTVCMQDTTK